jgi:integrase
VVPSVTTGLRTEEFRALRWNEVDLDAGTVAAYRAVRATADTKTPKSRRVLSLPQLAVKALREHLGRQAEDRLLAGALWQDHGLVFVSAIGTPLDHHNVRREFRKITQTAGLGAAGDAPYLRVPAQLQRDGAGVRMLPEDKDGSMHGRCRVGNGA